MVTLGDNTYGDDYAADYDSIFSNRDDTEEVARLLMECCSGRPALEFGVGTGRMALPLARLGIPVTGVDNSQAMIDQLKAKSDGHLVTALLGDAETIRVPGEFGLVFIGFSTLYLFGTQELQVQCFRDASRHLTAGGFFWWRLSSMTDSSGATTNSFAQQDWKRTA